MLGFCWLAGWEGEDEDGDCGGGFDFDVHFLVSISEKLISYHHNCKMSMWVSVVIKNLRKR